MYPLLLLTVALLALGACAEAPTATPTASPSPSPTPNPLAGGAVATFDVQGERFKVWVTNDSTIEEMFAVLNGTSNATIPNGPLLSGPGQADHNSPHDWHLDPEETEMADLTIEVCDGLPSYVDEHTEEFINQVGRYCPWSAELVNVVDYREAQ